MKEPIIVTIKNNLPAPRTLTWLGQGQKWIAGNGSIQVSYEPWSAANQAQRQSLLAELSNKWVSLTIQLLRADGSYCVTDYSPAGMLNAPAARPQAPKEDKASAVTAVGALAKDGSSHIVIAGGNKGIAQRMGFKAESAAPAPIRQMAAQEGVGFQAAPVENAPAGSLTTTEVKQAASAASSSSSAAVEVQDTVEEAPVAEPSIEEQFDGLTAEHRWADALRLLIDVYGEEKITFTTRAIIALKTFKAVAEKYEL